MKKESKSTARHRIPVLTGLILVALTAAACSSGSSALSSNANTSKPANAVSLLDTAYSQLSHASNVTENISMDIKYKGPSATQGTSAAADKREQELLSLMSKIHVIASINKSSGTSTSGKETELVSFDYQSAPLAKILVTTANAKTLSSGYFKIYMSDIIALPLIDTYTANTLNVIGLIIHPVWYQLPKSLLAALNKASQSSLAKTGQSSTGQIRHDLLNPELVPMLENFTNSLFTKGLTVTSVPNQDGTEISLSGNYLHLIQWFLPQYKNFVEIFGPKVAAKITKSTLASALAQGKSRKIQDDTFSLNAEITSANLLTALNIETKIVNQKNIKQYLKLSFNDIISYPSTPVTIPSNAMNVPSNLINYFIQTLTKRP